MNLTPSLQLSGQLRQRLKTITFNSLEPYIPSHLIQQYYQREGIRARSRVFTPESTIYCMVGAAFLDDRSQQNILFKYKQAFEQESEKMVSKQKHVLKKENRTRQGPGRPKSRLGLPKSMLKPLSTSTAALSKAIGRIPAALMKEIFEHSAAAAPANKGAAWHGRPVFIGDGTYFQLQDTPELAQAYSKEHEQSYPRGCLVALTDQASGLLTNFAIGNSELATASNTLDSLPKGSLFMGDDLYSCYAFWAKLQQGGVDFITACKRKRSYEVVKKLGPGDELVRIKRPANHVSKWAGDNDKLPASLLMRRISYVHPTKEGLTCVLMTSVTQPEITATDIVAKYGGRWDIELRIREIKVCMGVHIARSKTADGVYKEMAAALTAYNIVRALMAESVKSDFPPYESVLQDYYTPGEYPLVDKRGRTYHHWSPGRPAKTERTNQHVLDTKQA